MIRPMTNSEAIFRGIITPTQAMQHPELLEKYKQQIEDNKKRMQPFINRQKENLKICQECDYYDDYYIHETKHGKQAIYTCTIIAEKIIKTHKGCKPCPSRATNMAQRTSQCPKGYFNGN